MPWLLKTVLLQPAWRYLGELRYLVAVLRTPNLKRWRGKYVTLRAIKAAAEAGPPSPKPLLDVLRDVSARGEKMVVLGEPGSGKTTSLEALAHGLARRALAQSVVVWSLVFGLVGTAMALHSWWWGFLLGGIGLFDFLLPRLPVLAELRRYDSGTADEFLKRLFAGRIGGSAISKALDDTMRPAKGALSMAFAAEQNLHGLVVPAPSRLREFFSESSAYVRGRLAASPFSPPPDDPSGLASSEAPFPIDA